MDCRVISAFTRVFNALCPAMTESRWVKVLRVGWCRRADSNRQPIAYEAIALPLSYCGVQNGPCIKLLSNKPPPVEEAQSALSYPSSLPGFASPGLTRGPIHPLRIEALLFDGCPGQARA